MTVKRMSAALIVAAGVVAAGVVLAHAAGDPCSPCLHARFWPIPAADWTQPGPVEFPETARLVRLRPRDLGVAFSGGGTRSATATLGELAGLERNGWLRSVRYVSAVSGGAWAALPFTYSKEPLDRLLAAFAEPDALNYAEVVNTPNGLLANAIVRSSLAAGSVQEVAAGLRTAVLNGRLNQQNLNALVSQLVSIAGRARREPNRPNKTYARLIGSIFLDPLIEPGGPRASDRLFSWDNETVAEMAAANPGQLPADLLVAARDRPFLIVGGTLVSNRRDYEYPLLMPVEYTPLYAGVRGSFGGRFGGTYVWPWAYDTVRAGDVSSNTIAVNYDAARRFTLADVAASTSAAPQLALLLGAGVPESFRARVQSFSGFFPSFTHLTVHDGAPPQLSAELPHGDGGFIDNLALMPLLARQVRNILVFVNTNTRYFEQNNDVKSYFYAVGPHDGGGDKTRNQIFEPDRYAELMTGLWRQHDRQQALVACGTNWKVLGNEHYNIRPYDGLNICWIYNAAVPSWQQKLPDAVRTIVTGGDKKHSKGFDRFPWFATFEQNKPHLIQLTTPQVNLLAHLASWTVTNSDAVAIVRGALNDVLGDAVTTRGR